MKSSNTKILFVIVLFLHIIKCQISISQTNDVNTFISNTYQELQSQYWSKNQKFTMFPFKWQGTKGLYSSIINVNTLSKRNSKITDSITNAHIIQDTNMFVTSFVLFGLLEAEQLGTIKVDHHRFSESLEAISQFRDKNEQFGVPKYVFWPQSLINGTWTSRPINLVQIVNIVPQPPKWSFPILDFLGLGILTFFKDVSGAFVIPADNDDSSVNLALLGFLKQTNSQHYQFWSSLNYKIQKYYQEALKYAYRPFDGNYTQNPRADEIDTRTYYNYWQFIQMKKQQALARNQKPSLILVTTWLLSKNERIPNLLVMPFDTNNVDVTVCANFIFGFSYQVLTKSLVNPSQQLIKMILDTTDLLVYATENKVQKRPDIVLVYYPSKYDYYWFLARIVTLLKRYDQLPHPLEIIKEKITNLMKTIGTKNLLNNTKCNTKSNECYWAQFLGNYGKKNRNDDAIFSTALAMNGLIDTWSTRIKNKMIFDQDTPKQVKETVQMAAQFIMNKKSSLKLSNAFFSGSQRTDSTDPFIYPANICKDSKGKSIDPQTSTFKDLTDFGIEYSFKGTVSRQTYEKYLKGKWWGYDVPKQFTGYDDAIGLTFPFWNSKAITQILMITSLSKYLRLMQSQESQN